MPTEIKTASRIADHIKARRAFFFQVMSPPAVHLFYTAISACVLRIRQTYSHSIGTALGIVPHRAVSLQGRIPKIQHLLAAP